MTIYETISLLISVSLLVVSLISLVVAIVKAITGSKK